jgi:hypothetical protein
MRESTGKPFFLLITFIFALAALTVSCSLTKGKEKGELAAEQFHQEFNAGQYQTIYRKGDDKFQEAVTEAEFTEFLEAVRRKLGTVEKATPTGWMINATTMGTVVKLGYETQFSEGKGTEQFAFLISGDQATLLRYDINSPLLIPR